MKIFLFVLALWSSGVFAQALPVDTPRVNFPRTSIGNVTTFGPMTADAANASKFSFGAAANGSVFANTGTNLPTAGGSSVPIGVAGNVGKPSVMGAIGRFIKKGMPLLNTGIALYDLAQELGVHAAVDTPGGQVTFTKILDGLLGSTSGPYWNVVDQPGGASAACQAAAAQTRRVGLDGSVAQMTTQLEGSTCVITSGGPVGNGYLVTTRVGGGTSSPLTHDQFVDLVAQKSGWPSSSALGRTLNDALKAGDVAKVDPVTVTGPSSSPNGQTVTNNQTNNTTTTNTSTNNYTYAGPNVTTTTTNTSITVNNSTGTVSEQSSTVITPVTPRPPDASEKIETCGLPDTPPCKIDEAGVPDGSILKQDAAKDTYKQIQDLVNDPKAKLPQLPTISWDFALPTGCAVIPLPAFEPFVKPIDVCQFLPMFHDIMTVVWLLGGLFGAISMFFKSALAD